MKPRRPKRKYLTVAEVPNGLSLTEAAALMGVGLSAARRRLSAARRTFTDGRMKKWDTERRLAASRADWSKVDWSRADLAIARLLKVSRQRVYEQRKIWAPKKD